MAWRERLATLQEATERRVGVSVVPRERLGLLEARDREAGYLRRELDSLAWTALSYTDGRPHDLKPEERLKLVQKARVVWMKDPLAAAAVDLMNDFTFGRGIPKPKANDPLVQEILDEAWDDPDNQDALTSYDKQLELGIDLSLQSNLYFLIFDDGDDGKVKLTLLDHDTVVGVVRDTENRRRILYFRALEPEEEVDEWDYDNDCPVLKPSRHAMMKDSVYYEHWRNVGQADEDYEEGLRPKPPKKPPGKKLGEGKVFHIALNKTGEMAFGHPTFDRLIGWYNALNRFMDARVDLTEAKAAFALKRKVKGTPQQLHKQATQALSRRSALGMGFDPETGEEIQAGPKPASIINENAEVEWQDFKVDTGAAQAEKDAQMIRSQVSAVTRFPQSYYGDASQSNLATATSLELPVLKAVENRQEIFERVVRFFIDRVIERAVEGGRIQTELTPEEREELRAKKDPERQSGAPPLPGASANGGPPPLALGEAHEDAVEDEEDTERDLGYEFSMPNPLRRLLTDLVTSVQTTAQTFDPNNTNMELSRTLLTIALGEGFELEDPAAAVEKIFPEGYVDPAVAAAQEMAEQQAQQQGPFGEFAPGVPGADGQKHTEANPYGGPMRSQSPQKTGLSESRWWPRDRHGQPLDPSILREHRRRELPEPVRAAAARRRAQVAANFDETVAGLLNGGGS